MTFLPESMNGRLGVEAGSLLLLCAVLAGAKMASTAITDSVPGSNPDITFGRPTPLHFGMYVTPNPKTNPISPPERFVGYHVATDFEVSSDELNKEVPVSAVCDGKISYSGFASGYGGVITEYCTLDNQAVTVIYGHLDLASLSKAGNEVTKGQQIALLGAARSHDTDGNRKHLHLGIRRGQGSDMRGYVQSEEEIDQFLDPRTILTESPLPPASADMQPYWKTGSGAAL